MKQLLSWLLQYDKVHYGVRGSLEPPCDAVGLIDQLLLGESHLYKIHVYKRTEECSVNSSDYGPLPPNAPAWCLAPFHPEGRLSSSMADITCFLGFQYGQVIVHYKVFGIRTGLILFLTLEQVIVHYKLLLTFFPAVVQEKTLAFAAEKDSKKRKAIEAGLQRTMQTESDTKIPTKK
ncbi:hypothetical protein L6452_01862 [Arctium lappa]|uniref:Uncharacterized protein n=1 Tax=Arctium lappa TaxID=4217 RepID=A0ACB9FIM6_ARCLA|nr:hypothetical protein L6452_01862 [Arctium lappa]